MVIQQVLQQLPQNQVALAPVSILFPTTAPPVVEPLREESVQSNSSDVNNLQHRDTLPVWARSQKISSLEQK